MMLVVAPREPVYVKERNILFQIVSISLGSSPLIRSLTCRSTAHIDRFDTVEVPVISPQPVTPASVLTSTKTYSRFLGATSSAAESKYGAGASISQGVTVVIFNALVSQRALGV